ncbi:MAG: GT4 family glycosyltransferase PelF [Burkholderiales bacterium]
MSTRQNSVDIALLLEGTYPFVSGGVSGWVHQMLQGFPELTFAVIFIGSRRNDYGSQKYEMPPNVSVMQTHYLYDQEDLPRVTPVKGDAATFDRVERMHEYFRAPIAHESSAHLIGELADELDTKLSFVDFLYSERSYDFIRRQFNRYSSDPSFVDYFWTIRIMHAPIWRLAKIRDGLPMARAYHTISTGFAGMLGVLAKRKFGRPLIVSEHGIYTKERRIDLFAAQWIADNRSLFERDTAEIAYFRQLWIRFFEAIGRAAYDAADQIVALFEANRERQVADGAINDRTQNIPNGIDITRFAALREKRPVIPPRILCLVGRVVPIKDVKTFIRAMRVMVNRMPDVEGWIAGPVDEDPAYADECRGLIEALGLRARVKMLGLQTMTEILPKVGLVVLSSISEALPLSILEAFAAGIPVVTTDVGSCAELIYGAGAEDRALGAAGEVVGIANPQALAEAAVSLLADQDGWERAARTAIARVERYYSDKLMFDRYRILYHQALEQANIPTQPAYAASARGAR